MSNQRFLKLIDSEEADYLLENHPNAFLLLCLIAKRARRISGKPDGLEIGEAQIGDYRKAGIETRNKYRTALDVLIKRNHCKIVETCRKRKTLPTDSTTGSTTIGTKVSLSRSDVYDINPENGHHRNHHRNHHRTTTEPPPNHHEQERIKNDKNDKKEQCLLPAVASKKKEVLFSAEIMKAVDQIIALLKGVKPDYKPSTSKTIAKTIDFMVRLDNRSLIRILEIVSWASRDTFWASNILKPNPGTCLRKHFDQLDMKVPGNSLQRKQSFLLEYFKHGETYSGYNFVLLGDKITFFRTTGTSHKEYPLRLNDPNFEQNFLQLINSLNIEIPKT